jgi:hypothetical protein
MRCLIQLKFFRKIPLWLQNGDCADATENVTCIDLHFGHCSAPKSSFRLRVPMHFPTGAGLFWTRTRDRTSCRDRRHREPAEASPRR